MRNLRWICWYLWEGLPALLAFPIDSSKSSVTGESWSSHWEGYWPRYVIGTLGFVAVAFTLAGCLCCRRQRCPKGFQDDAGNGKEFKDGSAAVTETTIERHASSSLELEVPRLGSSSQTSISKVQFVGPCGDSRSPSKPKPPSPSLFSDVQEVDNNIVREEPCREWFEPGNRHVPRERLKYLREIGRGWFGKVVEGTTSCPENPSRSRGVVVRILTEEATGREKAWFLGEATPYLKLDNPNILRLLGSCLEADPYLLLFESCPAGDLKGFLRSNRDRGTCDTLRSQNVPTRIALDIASALEHMHQNGFAHTDLSARNCLVAPDLSAKLGDYGTGVEKYPGDYYIVGDRALPIRWSAPESLVCTATTIETRTITPRANVWSYGVLLWEIATWGERPYDDLADEQVIEMIFSMKSGSSSRDGGAVTLNKLREDSREVPANFREAVEASWKFSPDERSPLGTIREIICGKNVEDFEKRWENLRPKGTGVVDRDDGSGGLQDLSSGNSSSDVRARFRLGPGEPVESPPGDLQIGQESGSETEEESWRGRVERGAYTEKVKQKSKSVADLMVLVHIDSDSDAEVSLGPQNVDKTARKRLAASGSDGDLRSAVIADEFDEALRKLREPSVCNGTSVGTARRSPIDRAESVENLDRPKLLTLTQQGQTPILRLSFGNSDVVGLRQEKIGDEPDDFSPLRDTAKNLTNEKLFDREIADEISSARREEKSMVDDVRGRATNTGAPGARTENELVEDSGIESISKIDSPRVEGHVLRLLSKGDPDLPLLRYVPERASGLDSFLALEPRDSGIACFSNDFTAARVDESSVDVQLWNDALAHELEKKNPGYDADTAIFDNFKSPTPDEAAGAGTVPIYITDRDNDERSASVPNTPRVRESSTSQTSSSSAPDTPRNRHRAVIDDDLANVSSSSAAAYSVGNLDDDLANGSSSVAGYSVGNLDEDSSTCDDLEASERILRGSASAPDTPQSRGNYSVGNVDEDSSTGEELGVIKRSSHEADDEEDRKHLSTPDDERSSDSGFRDKESCEEEESPVPGTTNVTSIVVSAAIASSGLVADSSPLSASAEEEQMRILFELDTILDAEYYGSFDDTENVDERDVVSPSDVPVRLAESDEIGTKNRSLSESLGSTESTDVVETVRANSCEPDFLDSRGSREIGHDEDYRKLEDSRINGGKEDGKNSDICDATETDSMSECSLRTDHNQSVGSSSLGVDSNKRRNSSVDPEKNRGDDSSIDVRGSNVDSVGLEKNRGDDLSVDSEKNRGDDSSIDIHLSNVDAVDLEKNRGDDSSVDSEKNRGDDSSIDIHLSNVDAVDLEKNRGDDSSVDSEKNRGDDSSVDSHGSNVDSVGLEKDRGDDSSINIHGSNVDAVDLEKNRGDDSSVDSEKNRGDDSSIDSHGSNVDSVGLEKDRGDDSSINIHGSNVNSVDLEKNRGDDSLININRSNVDSVDLEKNHGNDSSVDSEKNRGDDLSININRSNVDSVDLEKNHGNDSSVDSEKNRGDDSSINLHESNLHSVDSEKDHRDASSTNLHESDVDSADSRENIDGSIERADVEFRSFDRSSSSKVIRESGDPMKNRGDDSSIELRGFGVDSSDSRAKIDELTDTENQPSDRSSYLERPEKFGESPMTREGEDSADSNPIIDLTVDSHCRAVSENSGASQIVLTDSSSRSSPRTDVKPVSPEKSSGSKDLTIDLVMIDRSSDNLIKLVESENLTSDPTTIYRSSDGIEKSSGSEDLTIDLVTIDRSSDNLKKPVESENLTSDPTTIYRSSDSVEKSSGSEDSTIDVITIDRPSDNLKKPVEPENLTSDPPTIYRSSDSVEKSSGSEDVTIDLVTIYRSSDNLKKPVESENLTSDPPTIYRSSDNLEKPVESENLPSGPTTIYRSSDSIEKPVESEVPTSNLSTIYRSSANIEKLVESEILTADLSTIHPSENLDEPSESKNSTIDLSTIHRSSENLEKSTEVSDIDLENSTIHRSSENLDKSTEVSDVDLENSTSDSPLKTGCRRTSDLSTEAREPDSVRSDGEQWSSRENINDNDDEEDSSTMSLRSDNSYVSFGLDEEFVTAIRNELREKLPRAQMPVVEALDPRDEKEPSINEDRGLNEDAETKRWEDDEAEENSERGSGGVDISIRYNIYGTPLSPILEERESAGTSESLVSKEDSRDASIASRVSALSEDVLVVDTLTNRAMMLDGTSGNGESSNLHQDDDRDTSHGDFSDDENLEYPQNNLGRGMESKRISMGSGGAPLPSPEEETKWQQQFPLPLQMQDDLMSTSFGTDRDWDSQDEDEGDDDGEDGEEDEEENSSSSGEFVWKRYDESHGDLENVATRSPPNKPKCQQPEADLDEEDEGDEDDEEEEEEFTPSAWDATLAPHRSALRSPEKTPKSGDQKKSVWFKKQRYHCVYEYPKETPVAEGQGQAATTWEPTSYADWEEMMDEPRLDVYPMEYDETNRAGDEEFYVSSSNRPFQFQSGEGKYVSQFFPGASSTLLQQQQQQQTPSREAEDCQETRDEVDRAEVPLPPPAQTNGNNRVQEPVDSQQQIQQSQLGELRHTRDRLKLNLLSTSGAAKTEEDIGFENRIQEAEAIEISEKEASIIPKRETEAPAGEGSSKIDEELRKYDGPLELKITDTEIVEDLSTTITKSPKNTNDDKISVVLEKTTETVEDSSRKIVKSSNEKSEEDSRERSMKDESSKCERIESRGENTRSDIGDPPSRPSDRDNLAVREASKDFYTKDDGTRYAPSSDYSAVIQGRDETDRAIETSSSSNDNSRTIGDQEDSSKSRIVEASSDTVVAGRIVDITKLETEESPVSARPRSVEDNSVIVEKSEIGMGDVHSMF